MMTIIFLKKGGTNGLSYLFSKGGDPFITNLSIQKRKADVTYVMKVSLLIIIPLFLFQWQESLYLPYY